MQFNPPINNAFPNDQWNPYSATVPYTDIIGEGEVVSLMYPDGSVQFYFVPLYRRERRFPNPYYPSGNGPLPWPPHGTEAWFIRKISTPPTFPNMMQERCVSDPFLRSYYASKGNVDTLPQNPYCQKFHNDNVTSTTDIQYFYPSLRKGNLKHSISIQVEVPTKNVKCSQTEKSQNSCSCNMTTYKKDMKHGHKTTMVDTSSAMSVDSDIKIRRKRHSRVKFIKSPRKFNHIELCSVDCKKADKAIATFTDQGIGCDSINLPNTENKSAGSSIPSPNTEKETASSSKTEVIKKSKSLMSCDSSCCDTCYYCLNDCTSSSIVNDQSSNSVNK